MEFALFSLISFLIQSHILQESLQSWAGCSLDLNILGIFLPVWVLCLISELNILFTGSIQLG